MAKKRKGKNAAESRTGSQGAGEAPPAMPGWAPAAIYALVTVVLFREFFLGGVSMLGNDSLALSYFARNFYTEFVQNFQRMPFWNPLLMGGIPFVEGMHGDIFYPPSLAMFFLDARVMWGWKMALHIFMAGIFTYLWLRRGLGLDPLPAFFGGLVYMLGADLVSLVLPGGDGKLFVSALAPLLFWLTERAVARQRAADFALFALGIALLIFTSHMQAAYFCVWGVSLYFMFRVWQIWRAGRSGILAARLIGLFTLAGVLGVGAAAVQFLPPLGYLQEYSHRAERAEGEDRGYEWSSTYSLNAEEIASLVVPEFAGEVPNAYWGKNPLKLNSEYAGLISLLLIPVLLLGRRTPQVWFFIGLAVLTLLYALASSTPLGRLFYLIPGVSLFRAWSMIIFLYAFAITTLGALAVQYLQDLLSQRDAGQLSQRDAGRGTMAPRRALWIGAGVLGLLALLMSAGALTGMWTAVFYRGIDAGQSAALAANEAYMTRGFWIATFIAVLTAGLWELASRGVLRAGAFVILLAVVAGIDLYRVDRPFIRQTAAMNEQADLYGTLFRPDETIEYLQRLRDAGGVFRVMDLSALLGMQRPYGQNDLAVHGIEQLAGHHGNEIGRYRSLIGGEFAQNMIATDLRLAGLTNTEYLVIPSRIEDSRLEEVHVGSRTALYRYRGALPRAFLVGSTEIVAGEAAMARYLAEDFDARTTVILEEPLPADVEVQAGAAGVVEWMEREPDVFTLRVVADAPAMLVVLDNYFPAWKAYVDDREVAVYRANYTFRAIAVPAGEHIVTFRYVPTELRRGAAISLVLLGFLLAVVLAGFWRDRYARLEPASA
ncbi:MAG: YfhO family protein [Gemmatimonadetes bacterium]|nr:YfhO family protein [Gemmatimonadota bacterium]